MVGGDKPSWVEADHYSLTHSDTRPKEMIDGKGEEQAPVPDGVEEKRQYPSMWKLIPITAGLCCSVFCTGMLTTCAVTLTFGKLYTYYPIKWVYTAALFLFELGSLVCGATPSSIGLIIGRAIAGVGAGGLFSGAMLIVATAVPLHKRPIYLGIVGAIFGISSVAGPLLGGALTDHATWRWCFYINLPFGAFTALVIVFFFDDEPTKSRLSGREKLQSLDISGTAIFLPSLICLLLALQWGGQKYTWSNWRIIVLFVLFGVGLCVWIYVQYRKQDLATVPPRIIRNRNVFGAMVYSYFLGGAFFIMVYYLPIWFQAVQGASATISGVMNLPFILGVSIFGIVAAVLVTVLGYCNPFMLASSVVSSIGVGLLTTLRADSGLSKSIGYQTMAGVGVGFGLQLPAIVVQAAVKQVDISVATSLVVFSQLLSGAVFISIAQNVFDNRLVANVQKMAPMLDPVLVTQAGATRLRESFPKHLDVVLQAYNSAVTQTFYIAVAASALSICGALCLQWISVKKKQMVMGGH